MESRRIATSVIITPRSFAEEPLDNHASTGPALEREQAARASLDEQDDEDENQDLAEDGAGNGSRNLLAMPSVTRRRAFPTDCRPRRRRRP